MERRFKLFITLLPSFVSYAQIILSLPNGNHSQTYLFMNTRRERERERRREEGGGKREERRGERRRDVTCGT